MPCLLAAIVLILPRVLIVILWFFTDWFEGVFDTLLRPVLGFVFLPVTTLWYSFVNNNSGGQWSTSNIVIMVVDVIVDTVSWRSGYTSKRG